MTLDVDGAADLMFCLAVATGDYHVDEQFVVLTDAGPLSLETLDTRHGTRVQRTHTVGGRVDVDYRAVVSGRAAPPTVVRSDLVEYLRPSRYAEADKLVAFATDQFGGLTEFALLDAVVAWVRDHIFYVPGSSGPTDGAIDSLLTRRGVCRDFAHLVAGTLRAMAMPARVVAVYAPGLAPMDFHAVVEAYVGDGWHVVDATGLAPRATLLRIATGRDAADTAFLSSYGGNVTLLELEVTATSAGDLPRDGGEPSQLG
jgi:transglutaminase-like putative cysteine protease